jgi:hypothetical protein
MMEWAEVHCLYWHSFFDFFFGLATFACVVFGVLAAGDEVAFWVAVDWVSDGKIEVLESSFEDMIGNVDGVELCVCL